MVLIYSKIGKMLLARRYRNDFLLLLLWWFPLGDIETKKINTGGSGKDPKVSFRAKDTGCEKLSSSGIIQYNPVVNSIYLTTPSFMLLQCLTPHSARHRTTSASDKQMKIKSNPPPSINGELLQKAIRAIFFPQEVSVLSQIQGCL